MRQEQTYDVNGVSLNYVAEPSSGPPLVLLHGITGCWQGWLPVLPELARHAHLFALDLRGHGKSGHTAGAYRINDYASDVAAFLHQQLDEPAVLVGHSLGAIVATAVAAEHPDTVRAVVLEDPPLAAFRHERVRDRPEYAPFTAMRDLARSGRTVDELMVVLADAQPGQDAAILRARATTLSQLDPDVLTLVLEDRAKEGYDQDACLQAIACPVLLLQGNPDLGGALSDGDAQHAANLLRRGVYLRLPEAGHGIHSSHPATFCRAVHDFLATL